MNEIFSEKVVTSRRTYYFDVKETREGAKYLGIGELTQVGSELERHRVMVFEESLDLFLEGLDKAVDFILDSQTVEDGDESRSRVFHVHVDASGEQCLMADITSGEIEAPVNGRGGAAKVLGEQFTEDELLSKILGAHGESCILRLTTRQQQSQRGQKAAAVH